MAKANTTKLTGSGGGLGGSFAVTPPPAQTVATTPQETLSQVIAEMSGVPLSPEAVASQAPQLAAAQAVADAFAAKGTPLTEAESSAATTGAPYAPPPVDWSGVLGIYGLPQSLIDQLNTIWKAAGYNEAAAEPLILAAVRSSTWYAQAYPGISDGIAAGLFTDERGYVAYENQVNALYNQYYGRAATGTEIASYLKAGEDPARVANYFQSQATAGSVSDPLKAIFSSSEIQAYADERSGVDSALGQKISAEINLYTSINPLFQTFYHRSPTKAELDGFLANGTDPQQIGQQLKAAGYLDAVDPVIKGVFTPEELQQMATEAAGGDTQHGKQLQEMANLASSLNEVYQVFYGSNVTRDELNQAYTQGYTAQHVQALLQSGVYSNSLPANVKNLFTQEELNQAGQEASGAASTPQGERILNIVKNAGSYADLAGQYGQTLTGDQLKQYYDQGFSATDYGNHLQGQAWATANQKDVQQASGAFGEGPLSPDQLSKLGDEKGGLDTPEGQQLALAYSKTLQRFNGVFQGALAKSATFPSRRNTGSSDVAA